MQWDQQPNESADAYARFCKYRDLGPSRSLSQISSRKGPSGHLQKISSRDKWVERCRAYDAHIEQHRQAAIVEAEKEAARRLVQRRTQVKELEYGIALKLFQRLNEAIDDKKRSMNNMASVLLAASAIARKSQGMSEEGDAEVAPDFQSMFFDTDGQVEQAIKEGVTPSMPEDVNRKPPIALSSDGSTGRQMYQPPPISKEFGK